MFTTIGALIGLCIAIALIVKRVPVVYSLILGAVAGALLGGMDLPETVKAMISGVQGIVPAILRILTAGVLSGVLVVTGASETIAGAIIRRLGRDNIYLALALSAMLLATVGVFVDVAVITVAPIAISAHRKYGISAPLLLLMLVGGGKAGNVISPNPNTIVAAENFGAPLSSVMVANAAAAVIGLVFTVWVVRKIYQLAHKTTAETQAETVVAEIAEKTDANLPGFGASVAGPLVAIALLALRPICDVVIDPLIALPAGGLVGLLCMRRWSQGFESVEYGLSKMVPVAILLIGTGAIAGVIQASSLKDLIVGMLSDSPLGELFVAPISGALMSAATASTTAGASLASSSFAQAILATGVPAIWGAAMVNSAATVLDHLPHGSFFHATGGSMELTFRQSLALIPYYTAVGVVLSLSTMVTYMIFG